MSVSDNSVAQGTFADYEPSGSVRGESLSDIIRVPGFWEADESCENVKPTAFCESGHVQFGGESPCGTRTCPHHWLDWRKRAAANIVARLAAYRLAQSDGVDRRALHVVAAPEQDQRWTLNRFWQSRSESYEIVEEAGARGGVCLPHPYRTSDPADELYQGWLGGEVAQERGRWRVIREYADDWDDMRAFTEVGPHFHHLAPVRDLDGDTVAGLEERTGWVVHNVRSLAPVYLDEDEVPWRYRAETEKSAETVVQEGFEDMARLVMYLLSHAAVQPSVGEAIAERSTVTYWGEVHPNGFDPQEEFTDREWDKIQRLAAEAVGHEFEEDGEADEDECWRGECEAVVVPLTDLSEYLSDVREYEGWFGSLDVPQQHEILGLKTYLGDRPPPGLATPDLDGDGESHDLPPGGFRRAAASATPDEVRGDREAFAEWLRSLGRRRIDKYPALAVQVEAAHSD